MVQRVRHPRAPTSQEGFAGGCWFCAGSTLLFRRAPVLEAVGLQDERPPRLEDCDWTLRFGLAEGELVVQPVVAVAIEISSRPSAPKIDEGCDILAAKWRKETMFWTATRAPTRCMAGPGTTSYLVDDAGDVVLENAGEGADAVFSTAHFSAVGERGVLWSCKAAPTCRATATA